MNDTLVEGSGAFGSAGILVAGGSTLEINRGEISRNIARNTSLKDEVCNGNAAGISIWPNAKVTLNLVIFEGNHADNSSEAIDNFGLLTLTGPNKFLNNTANIGGAIYSQSTLDMNNCDITDNEAELSGGGIFNDATGTLNLNGGRIERNEVPTSTYTGGGVYNRGVLNINGCSIAGDTRDDIHDEDPIHE